MAPVSQQGRHALIVASVLWPIDCIFVFLRLWARRIKRTPFKISDYLICVALLFSVVVTVLAYILAFEGEFGIPITEASKNPEKVRTGLKAWIGAVFAWSFPTCLTKISVLAFYLEVFEVSRVRKGCHFLIGFNGLCFLLCVLEPFLICQPLAYQWDPSIEPHSCGDRIKGALAIAIINSVMDISIIVLPLPTIWKLQMEKKKKIAVCGILSLGVLVAVFSILRIVVAKQTDINDPTGTNLHNMIWGEYEYFVGIMTACLPLLRPVATKMFAEGSTLRSLVVKTRSRLSSQKTSSRSDPGSGTGVGKTSSESWSNHSPVSGQNQEEKYLRRLYGESWGRDEVVDAPTKATLTEDKDGNFKNHSVIVTSHMVDLESNKAQTDN